MQRIRDSQGREVFGSELWPLGFSKLYDSTLGADAASFDITGIPANYDALFIVMKLRDTQSGVSASGVRIRYNGDTANNYDRQGIGGANTTTSATTQAAAQVSIALCTSATADANAFATTLCWIPEYAGSKRKTAQLWSGTIPIAGTASSYNAQGWSQKWRSTSAINQVTIVSANGVNFLAASRVALYAVSGPLPWAVI